MYFWMLPQHLRKSSESIVEIYQYVHVSVYFLPIFIPVDRPPLEQRAVEVGVRSINDQPNLNWTLSIIH